LLLPASQRQESSIEETVMVRIYGAGSCLQTLTAHNMEQAFCVFPFFFFLLGGWSTTLMAASKTALTFCHKDISRNTIQ